MIPLTKTDQFFRFLYVMYNSLFQNPMMLCDEKLDGYLININAWGALLT